MKSVGIVVIFLALLTFALGEEVLYSVDFSKAKEGDAKSWLKSKGFELLLDTEKLSMNFSGGKLLISTPGQYSGLFGIRFPEGKYLKNVDKVKIVWGVEKFPKGADWSKGNNRLAIGALFTLGTEKLSSGLPFGLNAVPPFLGPFIGEKEQVGKRYLGALYKEGGRYYCVSNGKAGKTVATTFYIDKTFRKEFHKSTPPLTAFGFQMNTKDTTGGAKAFIQSITFYRE